MTTCIVIGAYKLTEFCRLNILRCRRIFGPFVPILISDDRSDESAKMQQLADELECDYTCSETRRSHFSGDMQSFLNGLVFSREIGADVVLKLSQRFILVLPEFRAAMERAFDDDRCKVVLPGQLNPQQIARPGAKFYRKFGILTDALAMRSDAIEPEELLRVYRERNKGKPSDSFSETTFGFLLDQKFPGAGHKILPQWTNHQAGRPKLYLRKSQSSASDYKQVAMMEGLDVKDFDLREWMAIEGRQNYKPKADVV